MSSHCIDFYIKLFGYVNSGKVFDVLCRHDEQELNFLIQSSKTAKSLTSLQWQDRISSLYKIQFAF